ncbi:DUF333 domain-containing protein [Candidatus Micrarchaeota archaeon]|nr:DUF333 domain-containing protein [Candidatus Micrarchaeota archaeon]
MKYAIVGFVLIGLLFAGCLQPEVPRNETNGTISIPNPAAENCAGKGYIYEIKTDSGGGEYGVCGYSGRQCEEWALYRGECCLTDGDCPCEGPSIKKCEAQACSCTPILPQQNETAEEPPPQPPPENTTVQEPQVPRSDKTVNQFLQDGLATVNSEFYAEHATGEFTVETYTWILGNVDMKPDQIPIGGGDLERAVLFNGQKANNIKGFAFKIYIPKDGGRPDAKGIAVFNAQTAALDLYYANRQYDLDIAFYPFSRNLYDCVIKTREQYLAGDGSYITAYLFECGDSGAFTT